MSVDLLLKEFHRISEAPDAVPRLRRFILDLAVRGKLVPQDANDEPANALLRRIESRKSQLLRAEEVHSLPKLPPVAVDDVPYPLPSTWCWIRLGDAFQYDAGEKTEPSAIPIGSWLLELEDIEKDSGKILSKVLVEQRSPKSTKSKFLTGDVLYGKLRPYLNKAVVADAPGFSTTEIVAIRCYGDSAPHYTSLALRRPDFVAYVDRLGQGTKMPRLRTEAALRGLFPLAPVAEQHRIGARVEELLSLCDELEGIQTKREARRDKLVAASLVRLTTAPNKRSFKESARFYFKHLPRRLTVRTEHVRQLWKAALEMAMQGKLVRAKDQDESVDELLAQISQEQKEAIRNGLLKEYSLQEGPEAPEAFGIPIHWRWTTLGQLITMGPQNGLSPRESKSLADPKCLTLTATTSGLFNPVHYKHVGASAEQCKTYWLREGDILFQRGNTREYVGIAAIYEGPPDEFIFPDLMIRVRFATRLNLRYIHAALVSPALRNYFSTSATGASSSMPKISQTILLNALVPIPPAEEQRRIIAKLDEILSICNELDQNIKRATQIQTRLLEATIQQSLASSDILSEIVVGA
jgi:type I restriction enzyme, S subunit